MAAKTQISRVQLRRGVEVDISGIVLNSGELGLAADTRRVFLGNRVNENAPFDENIELLTEFSTIDSTQINYVFESVAFTTLGSPTVFLTFDPLQDAAYTFTYKLTQGLVKRQGTFRIITDAIGATFDDSFLEIGGATAVVLSAAINGSDLEISYDVTATSAVFEYSLLQF